MPVYGYFLQFLSGMFLTNAMPHLMQGLAGYPFPTPFAKPPGVGMSPPQVNVYWGMFSMTLGLLLLSNFTPASAHDFLGWGLVVAGSAVMGTRNSRHFGAVRAGNPSAADKGS